ncbi:GH13321 [Drosophila grimshawi]|uniref:GH13321 n=1 Tax=Drosophila grimshawi TaxID=7222 RepID=B4JPW6_DROGR|nr:GH13321 [Drosophila grimshawi]
MSSIMFQVQQLTNSQLYILCYNYNIAPHQVANMTRRQLERRLHVAIVTERAKWIARDLLHGSEADPYPHNRMAWQPDDSSGDDEPCMPLSQWRYLAAEERARQRYSGGDEYIKLEQPSRLALCMGEEQFEVEDAFSEGEPQPEPALMHKMMLSKQTNTPSVEPDTDYQSLSFSSEDSSSGSYLSASSVETIQPSSGCKVNQMKRAEHCNFAEDFSQSDWMQSESEAEFSSEQELCTIKYLNEGQLLAIDLTSAVSHLAGLTTKKDSSSLTSIRRQRPSLLRKIVQGLCCDSQGRLDVDKLRCTIICCVVVVCTYVGIKMLQ